MKLGKHKGAPYYTIGQRKGLEIALGKPAYVLKINPQKNTVMLGNADQLETEYMLAEQDKMVDERELFGCENLTVRIRYRSRPIPCRVKRLEDGRKTGSKIVLVTVTTRKVLRECLTTLTNLVQTLLLPYLR